MTQMPPPRPLPPPRPDIPPLRIGGWQIVAQLGDGSAYTLRSAVYGDHDPSELMRLCDAVADGLRRAGFPTEVTVTRETQEVRS